MTSKLNNVGVLQKVAVEVFYALELNFLKILLEFGNIPLCFVLECKRKLLSRCIPLADSNISILKVHISKNGC